jgi:hypothetical protein
LEARELVQTSIARTGTIDLCHHIEIRNEAGAIVHVLHFEDALTVQRGPKIISGPSAVA